MTGELERVYAEVQHRIRSHAAALRIAQEVGAHDAEGRLPSMVAITEARLEECQACLALVAELLEPPAGWFAFGTHANDDVPLAFSEVLDIDGEPLWERPRVRPSERAPWDEEVWEDPDL